jgi:cell division protein FtsI/penicillin-binding protein 2
MDIIIQHMVEEELAAIARKFNPDKATIIVSDAKTGFILAMGNYPSFDLNKYNTAPLELQRNYAITDQLDPGSTFKIVPASGALNENLVQPNTRFDCSIESILYKGAVRRFMPDDHHYDHMLPVSEIISRSSNVGAAQLGMVLGEQRLYDYARLFGFGEKSGFPFGGEISGLLNPVSKWSGIDITRIPAGYSISATPLQIHYAMGTIASGGLLLRPQIIKQVRDASGEIVYSFDTVSRHRAITTKTAQQVARMLQGVVMEGGTAIEAAIPGYEVAGKTGTAQKLINGRYSNKHHVGSFVGFFPANRPEVVISVIVDNAKVETGNAYGRVVGAPSFKRLGEQLIQYLDIKPPYISGRNMLAMKGNPK